MTSNSPVVIINYGKVCFCKQLMKLVKLVPLNLGYIFNFLL